MSELKYMINLNTADPASALRKAVQNHHTQFNEPFHCPTHSPSPEPHLVKMAHVMPFH